MVRRAIRLYVSAGRDLEAERDVIGRVVAELPVTAGWEIGRTPGWRTTVAVSAVDVSPTTCDLFIFLLGQDISAPAGSEWDAARASRRPMLALLKDVARTPAGLEFQRLGQDLWVRFGALEELERQVREWLVRQLLDRAEQLRLTLPEVERLAALRAEAERSAEAAAAATDRSRAAAGGGVILPSPPGRG
ncbi:MAG: hypothetical protein NZ528_10150 [Caldilineales bacterium]|nr:hypothetical protein [Caldilineales bacterium]MDW8316628.1 hypothetical protein [Anaerolineae bacterium]